MKDFTLVKPVPDAIAIQVNRQVQHAVAEARQRFAADVDTLLTEVRGFVDQLPGDHFGRITKYEAWCHLRQHVLDKFDQRSPLRSEEVTLLKQLVRDAHDALTNPATRVNVRAWAKAAAPFLEK